MQSLDLIKKIVYAVWILIVVAFAFLFLFKREFFNPEVVSHWLQSHSSQLWVTYIVISFLRGFFLIPSTPFVLLGVVLFPSQPWAVLAVSMAGVVFSATLLYFYSDTIGFSDYLEEHYPEKAHWMKDKLGGRYQLLFIYGWSIFPPVPTDLICYVTGILRVNYFKMIAGVFLGEFTLNIFYVMMGQKVIEWMW